MVDAGTAVKVDSVDANGQHLGGLIVPGIHMMREVLMSKTSDIAKAVEHSTPSLAGVLANNTIGAVSRGAVFALAGMADRAAEVIEQSTGTKPKLFINRRRRRHDYRYHALARRDRAGFGVARAGCHRGAALLGLHVFRPGPRNLITDVPGLIVGHATDERVRSGVTVLLCAADWPAGVDVRGGGPGTRETDALSPENLVGRVHALVLAGGSVFGLAAADGVAAALSVRDIGLHLRPGSPAIPIVPAAVLHDLGNGGDKTWGLDPPYRSLGMHALAAVDRAFSLGSVGAGRGAMAGTLKGGIGSASIDLGEGLVVGALVALNSVGSALMPDGKTYWAWPFEQNGEFGGATAPHAPVDTSDPAPDESRLRALGRLRPGANTTLGVVACTADLSTVECKRLAMMAQDGIARAVRPAHTPYDGDTLFAVASGAVRLDQRQQRAAQIGRLGSAAADCMARSIARAVHYSR